MRHGDEQAARRLFEMHQPMVLRFLRSQEPRAADDLAGEVWVGVASSIHRFEGDAAGFRAWLFTIARRRLIEHRRRGMRRPTVGADSDELAARAEPGTDDPGGPIAAQEAVDRLLADLTEDQAMVVSLRVLADLDVAAVARIMERTESWVRVTQHRALRRLARKLGTTKGVTK